MFKPNLPLVSICIPTYNGEKYIRECLNSAIGQTYSNIEILIVDDQSNDGTIDVVSEYLQIDSRIKLFINKRNLGLTGNWNQCLKYSNGEWIKYLFHDDLLKPTCIERMVGLITENCKMIVSDREFIFDNSTSEEVKDSYLNHLVTLRKIMNSNSPIFIQPESISKLVSKFANNITNRNFIGEPSVLMFKKTLLNEIGDFDPLLIQVCDFEYWLRISTNFGLMYIPETLASFRVHGQSTTENNRSSRIELVDTCVLLYNLLKSDCYNNFRKKMSPKKMKELLEMFKLRIYEIKIFLKNNQEKVELIKQYETVKAAIPVISEYEIPSLTTKLIYSFVKLRRKIRS